MANYNVNLNGRIHSVDVEPDTPLLWVLRDAIGLTGTKFGCGIAQCGACTVFLDGRPLRSCSLPVASIGAAQVTTIEGLSGREADAVQRAWVTRDVPQCSYCQSGQVMSAVALLRRRRSRATAISISPDGSICRCTYVRIHAAIQDAAVTLGG